MPISLPDLQSVNPLFQCASVMRPASFGALARCVYWFGFPILKRASTMAYRKNEERRKSSGKISNTMRIADAALVVLIGR
jgi:hypothetical protein